MNSPARICLVVAACVFACASCVRRLSAFRVEPATPSYLLRSPDSRQTPFPEILLNYNGFEPGRDWVDLRPGMELRIENAYYQPGMPKHGLNGFLGTETALYKVGRRGLQRISVQSMKGRPSEQPPVQQLIRPSEMHDRWYRFYYEVFFRNSRETKGSVLLGARQKKELDRLSDQLLKDPDSVCGAHSRNCSVFPEVCSVSIEMEIVVNGTPRSVTWGSALANLLGQARHIELSRMYHGRLVPVQIDARDANALRLPLLPGDQVKVR